MRFDWVVVGAGFSGAVLAERIAAVHGQRVLVVDRRSHVAGNAYDYVGTSGVTVSKFGPHIFHTNAEKVWRYCSRFTDWIYYQHKVLGYVEGQLVPIPANFNTVRALFPARLADRIETALLANFRYGERASILKLRETDDPDLKFFADYVFDNIFLNYTRKQWDMEPSELSPSVLARVPVVMSRDDRYFGDRFQGIPVAGYTAMFQKMLSHRNIVVTLETDFADIAGEIGDARLIFTGPLDELCGYAFEALPYRSMRFRFVHEDVARALPVGTINYPNDYDFTRVTEQKHFTRENTASTTLIYEHPQAHVPGENEPYYPIPNDANNVRHKRYLELARQRYPGAVFVGRLADYRYYNMDQAVARALHIFDELKP